MKIALPYDCDRVHADFGRAQEFVVYHFEYGRIAGKELVEAPGTGYEDNIDTLIDVNAGTLICHGIEAEALDLLHDEGFEVFSAKQGATDGLVTTYMAQKLPHGDTPFTLPDPEAGCGRHGHGAHGHCGHHHSGGGHGCGHHHSEKDHRCGHHGHQKDRLCDGHGKDHQGCCGDKK